MGTEGIIRTSEIVITQLPYRDEFILVDTIRSVARSNTFKDEFERLGYDFDKWNNPEFTSSVQWITQQLVNGNVIKHTRSVFDEPRFATDEYYALTKTGRKMKGEDGLRTFKQLHEWEEKKKKDKQTKKSNEAIVFQHQADMQPLMKSANKSAIEANNLSRTTNTLIAIFTAFAGGWYLYDLLYRIASEDTIVRHLNKVNPHYKNLKFIICFVCTGLIIFLIYARLRRSQSNRKRKEEQLK